MAKLVSSFFCCAIICVGLWREGGVYYPGRIFNTYNSNKKMMIFQTGLKFSQKLIILLIFSTVPIYGQKETRRDTIIDFNNHVIYNHIQDYNNRIIEEGDNILYVLISFKGTKDPKIEYFRISEFLFKSIEYYESGNVKSAGNFILSNEISDQIDTLISVNPRNPDDFSQTIVYFKNIVKTGKWRESSDHCCIDKYGDYWEGDCKDGKRVGLWRHCINSICNYEIGRIDYDKELVKSTYIDNLGMTMTIDSLENILQGRWVVSSCENSSISRILLSKCMLYDGNYGDNCNNRFSKINYYDFLDQNNFRRQRGEGCNKFKESSSIAKWQIIRENTDTYIIMNFIDSKENWKFKLIYLDIKGTLVIERL